jgi:hypothetical protein
MWQNIFIRQNENWRWGGIIGFCGYLHVFINVFQPYKGKDITYIWASSTAYWLHMVFNFAIFFLVTALLLIVLPRFFTNFFNPVNFNLKKLIGLFIIGASIISMGCFLGNAYFFNFPLTLLGYLSFAFDVIWMNLFLTSFPFGIAYLFLFTYFTNENQQKKALNNQDLNLPIDINPQNEVPELVADTPQYKAEIEPKILTFTDTSNKKKLQVSLDKLYYIASSQNYIEVFYQNGSAEVKRIVLRNSLKAIEAEMIETTNLPLLRCHKAFIVNLEKVIDFRGSSHAAQFILENIDTPIPVSRQKYGEVKPLFSNLPVTA